MKLTGPLGIVAVSFLAGLVLTPSPAVAAYSCKGDKRLDVPMQFAAVVEGSARVHVSAYGGSDKSKSVAPASWRLYNASNVLVDEFPKALVVFASMNMFRETNIDGLVPGATYTVELRSKDFCNNFGTVRQSVTLPTAGIETAIPDLSTPKTVQVGLQSFATVLHFAVEDDSGVRDVVVSINGVQLARYVYANGVNVRWWTNEFPDDNTLSTLEGPNYYVAYPDGFKGQSALVEVVVTDVHGNQATQSAVLVL